MSVYCVRCGKLTPVTCICGFCLACCKDGAHEEAARKRKEMKP